MDVVGVALGAAHASVFGVLALSGTGKLVGCQRGSRLMCAKAGIDLGLAALSALLFWPGVVAVAALAVAAMGGGGWLRETLRKSKVCNCFGVLTLALEPWRNHARAILFAGGVGLLAQAWRGAPVHMDALLAGAAGALSLLLLALGHTFARTMAPAKPVRVISAPREADPALRFDGASVAGHDAGGKPVQLAQLFDGERPLALLLSAPDCSQCALIKNELDPVLGEFPFPLHVITEGEPAPGHGQRYLFDAQRRLRRSAAIVGVPSMIVLDPRTMQLAQPASFGPEEIRRDLLRLLLAGPAQPLRKVATG